MTLWTYAGDMPLFPALEALVVLAILFHLRICESSFSFVSLFLWLFFLIVVVIVVVVVSRVRVLMVGLWLALEIPCFFSSTRLEAFCVPLLKV